MDVCLALQPVLELFRCASNTTMSNDACSRAQGRLPTRIKREAAVCRRLYVIRSQTTPHEWTTLHILTVRIPCGQCGDQSENWQCLQCHAIGCSRCAASNLMWCLALFRLSNRFVASHMAAHNEESQHPLAVSFSDLSVWCYACDSYVANPVCIAQCNAAAHMASASLRSCTMFGCCTTWPSLARMVGTAPRRATWSSAYYSLLYFFCS